MTGSRLILPPRLSPGDLIGVLSPARWLEPERLDEAAKRLEQAGFRVRLDDQNALRDGTFAGPDAERAAAIARLFADPEVRAIMCARGGYGALRIVDSLDYGLIRANPKIFVGYSDVTALLLAIRRRAGLATFHGPMLVDLARDSGPDLLTPLVAALTGAPGEAVAARTLRPGSGEGRLIGGNLTILTNLIGTPDEADTRGAVLFVEDVDEYLYNIDRMLVHLKRAGRLDGLAALVLGSFSGLKDNETPFGRTVEEMVLELCAGSTYPIVANFPVGHDGSNLTLPIGQRARVEAKPGGTASLRLLGSAVS